MRKRVQTKETNEEFAKSEKTKKTMTSKQKRFTKDRGSKGTFVPMALAGIFILVLILNSFFIVSSGAPFNQDGTDVSSTYYLSGPDPYYNMRIVEQTMESGIYEFYGPDHTDPLLNYAIGRSGSRAPLMNMLTIALGAALNPVLGDEASIGIAMQFMPALFGALLVIPVYLLGATLFGKKEGLLAALLVAIIPIQIGSGHGSAYGLFDHDSFNLFFFALSFYFLIRCAKEKDRIRGRLYAVLGGISLAAITMTWVEARFIYAAIGVYVVVQMLFDMIFTEMDQEFPIKMSLMFFTGYLVSLPVLWQQSGGFSFSFILMMCLVILVMSILYTVFQKKNIPGIVSVPFILIGGILGVTFLYFVPNLVDMYPFLAPFNQMSQIIFGSGIYGNKVDMTIAEAGTFNLSRTVMSFGPALYWLAWCGVFMLGWRYFRGKHRKDYLFMVCIFAIDLWLTVTAGRFLNDLVPIIALLSAFVIWFIIGHIDYKSMLKNYHASGGGIHGLRKGVKIYHVVGVLFVALLVVMPNVYLAMDAAIPNASVEDKDGNYVNMKTLYFGEDHGAAFGSSFYKEEYWVNALSWLSTLDTEILNPNDRPAVISWWDYGFYEVAVGDHPTVADNFQDGIPPASNFHTSVGEMAGVSIWIARLVESATDDNNGVVPQVVKDTLIAHLGENGSAIAEWIENPQTSPSYGAPIGPEYDPVLSQKYRVGTSQYPSDAYYQDIADLLVGYDDEEIVISLYHDIQEVTGKSIRYYAVEGYDEQIFNIFGFLADKSLVLYALQEKSPDGTYYNPEDDCMKIFYVGYIANSDGSAGTEQQWSASDLNNMTETQKSRLVITSTSTELKEEYYETMFYRTYVGDIPSQLAYYYPQLPTWGMKHFYVEYVSEIPYSQSRMSVVIAKYYEGASINGTVLYNGTYMDCDVAMVKTVDMFGSMTGIEHDTTSAVNGSFSVLSGAGEVTLQIQRYPALGPNAFLVESFTFNETGVFAPISDDEAMRKGEHTRDLGDITIDSGNIFGVVYNDVNQDGKYDPVNDTIEQDAVVTIQELLEFNDDGSVKEFGDEVLVAPAGRLRHKDLRPGYYYCEARVDGVIIHNQTMPISQGNNSYNISVPLTSDISGGLYKDVGIPDKKDLITDPVDLVLTYTAYDGNKEIESKTVSGGYYSFSDLYPGNYVIEATLNYSLTPDDDFYGAVAIDLTENITLTENISLTYSPVMVSGDVSYEGMEVSNATISFSPDTTVEDNTAQAGSATSGVDGAYVASLVPGAYVVTVKDNKPLVLHEYTGTLVISIGSEPVTYDMGLEERPYKVTGLVSYESEAMGDIRVTFSPDPGEKNNTAVETTTVSNTTGIYMVDLTPGVYIVSVDQTVILPVEERHYSFTGYLTMPSEDRTYNVNLLIKQ